MHCRAGTTSGIVDRQLESQVQEVGVAGRDDGVRGLGEAGQVIIDRVRRTKARRVGRVRDQDR